MKMNWSEFNKTVMERVFEIVDNTNALCFKVMGYRFLHKRLILYFEDCKQVYDFNLMNEEKTEKGFVGEYDEKSFFTKDWDEFEEYTECIKSFSIEMKVDVADEKVVKRKK